MSNWKRVALALAAALVLVTTTAVLTDATGPRRTGASQLSAPGRTTQPVAGKDVRPNIVLVMTDDQNDYELRWMPRTRAALQESGVDFVDAISPHPLCCPARAEVLTGQYAQNNGVRHNKGPYGGFGALDPSQTIATWFRGAGYSTGFVGKYLNKYGPQDEAQPGWEHWEPLVRGIYNYRDFTFADGPAQKRYRDDYVTDVIGERSVDLVRQFARRDRPFLLFSWHLAPHYRFTDAGHRAPPLSASRDRARFTGSEPVSIGKPSFRMSQDDAGTQVMTRPRSRRLGPVRAEHRARIRSLQAVDRSVAALVDSLKETGAWENTFMFFTSDNGFLLGEHHLLGKNVLLEEALQIPLLVAGPGIGHSVSEKPVSLVDLPATFADIAGITPDSPLDGSSFLPLLRGRSTPWRDTTLVQTGRSTGNGWALRGVRTDRYLYATGEDGADAMLLDRQADPYQLTNFANDPAYAGVRSELEARREQLLGCAGEDCNRLFGPVSAPATEVGVPVSSPIGTLTPGR